MHGRNARQSHLPGIAARAEVGVVEQVNGRRRYYRSYGYPYAYNLSAWAPTALLVPTIPVACRFGVADRTTRPIIDPGRRFT